MRRVIVQLKALPQQQLLILLHWGIAIKAILLILSNYVRYWVNVR